MAKAFIETLLHYRGEKKYLLHEFVLMPEHFHLIITPNEITLERAMQFIKGGSSHKIGKDLGSRMEIWQKASPIIAFATPEITLRTGITCSRTP